MDRKDRLTDGWSDGKITIQMGTSEVQKRPVEGCYDGKFER
jgi:hypothetical protein